MSNHTPPIVPHVLYVADQHHPWQLAPIERLATRYHTPTTVALAFGTIDATVKPVKGKSGATKQQYHVWCVPDDTAWARVTRARTDLQLAIDAFADELRHLGSYATRLEQAGGLKKAPNPLSPTVIGAPDPDSTDTSWWVAHPIPRIDRSDVAGHTPKMLHITRDGKPWSTTHQRDHFVCPDDAAWQSVQDCRALVEVAHTRWQALLSELGTYQDALLDGRYTAAPKPASAALIPAEPTIIGVPMMNADEARATLERMAADLTQVDASIATFRQKALDFAEREGWRALGYSSSAAAINAELGTQYSKSYLSRLLNAAKIERLLELPLGNAVAAMPERTLRPLGKLEEADQREAWNMATAAAAGAVPSTAHVEQAVNTLKLRSLYSNDNEHINAAQHILQTLDQWDDRERPRLIQNAYSHARQIRDNECYTAMMAEIDRVLEEGAAPAPIPAKQPTPHISAELEARAVQLGLRVSVDDDGYRTLHAHGAANYTDHATLADLAAFIARKEDAAALIGVRGAPQPPTPDWNALAKLTYHLGGTTNTTEVATAYRAIGMLLRSSGVLPALPTRPRAPRSADISDQLQYLGQMEDYADALEVAVAAREQAVTA